LSHETKDSTVLITVEMPFWNKEDDNAAVARK